ncbi:major facilitator superfamily domain-containing protein [Mycena galericulata]|nr:major facilitator superfamily domain-containing protein [Mycena galericulata]
MQWPFPILQMSTINDEAGPPVLREEPYSIFTAREKWFIVSLIAFGGLLSPLSGSIYFPAIPTLAVAFNKSIELINLTVTLNMVFQGTSPMFWGTLSDTYGRRHIFIMCLLLLTASCIGLALTPTKDYWLLLFLRCFQAAGSASTIAIGAGVIGDISTRAEPVTPGASIKPRAHRPESRILFNQDGDNIPENLNLFKQGESAVKWPTKKSTSRVRTHLEHEHKSDALTNYSNMEYEFPSLCGHVLTSLPPNSVFLDQI